MSKIETFDDARRAIADLASEVRHIKLMPGGSAVINTPSGERILSFLWRDGTGARFYTRAAGEPPPGEGDLHPNPESAAAAAMMLSDASSLRAQMDGLRAERDALRAKVAELEARQTVAAGGVGIVAQVGAAVRVDHQVVAAGGVGLKL